MSRARVAALAALLALPASALPASAEPLKLSASPDAPARVVVNAVFRDYLAGKVGAELQTGVVDLDGDGTAEIVARFVHSSSCRDGMKQCRTVVLRHEGEWRIVIDRPADTFEQAGQPTGFPAPVKLDGDAWSWSSGGYRPSDEAMGRDVEFSPVPASNVPAIAAAFGAGAGKLSAAGRARFSYARPELQKGAYDVVVRMDGESACGITVGCPVRVLRQEGKEWKTVLSASTLGGVALSKGVRSGVRDISVKTERGYTVLGWTGSGYSVADRVESLKK